MDRSLLFSVVFACMAMFAAIQPPAAQSGPTTERQKIEALIEQLGNLKDAKFVRNGSTYEPATAIRFLRRKWEANDPKVKTARDFIDKIASVSSSSGKPYLIRFKDGREINSREYLNSALDKII
jgi:hypothetical protein